MSCCKSRNIVEVIKQSHETAHVGVFVLWHLIMKVLIDLTE